MPNAVSNLPVEDLRRRSSDLRGLADARLVVVDNGPGRGQRLLLLRNAAGLCLEIALDRGFDISAVTFRGINLGWNAPVGLPRPSHPHDLEDGFGMLRSLDGFLVTCGLDNYGLPLAGSADHLAYPLRKSIHYPLHGRISSQAANLIGYGTSHEGQPSLWCEAEIRQAAVFGEALVLRRRIEMSFFESEFTISDTVVNRGFRPARHGLLYHINLGYPFLDESASLTGHFGPLVDILERDPPVPRDDAEEEVDSFEPESDSNGIVCLGIRNPRLSGGISLNLRYSRVQLPRLALWRCWQSGHYALGVEPCTGLRSDALTYGDDTQDAFLAAGDVRQYQLHLSLA